MDLKGLIHRELGEGLTETELATAVGVSLHTIEDILSDKPPQDPTIWEKFATHFRMDADFLRTGESTHPQPWSHYPKTTSTPVPSRCGKSPCSPGVSLTR